MKIIVPLAGPDFDRPDGSVKAEITAENNLPLLRSTLESRPWWRRSQVNDGDLIFVIRDTAQSRRFSEVTLPSWYPRASIVKLSCLTQGAAFSALAGISLIANDDNPLCVDLVDINYASSFDPEAFFSSSGIGGVALVFESVNPMYSYVRLVTSGSRSYHDRIAI